MDHALLQALVDEGLTVREIAARVGKGYSTVRYWLVKHGLQTLHRGPGRTHGPAGLRRCRTHGGHPFVTDVGALHFHHVDPRQKSFQLGVAGLTRSLAAMRAEAAKCVLLCSNCHAEVEGGIVSLV
jgi:hypothetical protein